MPREVTPWTLALALNPTHTAPAFLGPVGGGVLGRLGIVDWGKYFVANADAQLSEACPAVQLQHSVPHDVRRAGPDEQFIKPDLT